MPKKKPHPLSAADEVARRARIGAPAPPPKALDAIADVVLAYRPKPKTVPAKRRKRQAAKAKKG